MSAHSEPICEICGHECKPQSAAAAKAFGWIYTWDGWICHRCLIPESQKAAARFHDEVCTFWKLLSAEIEPWVKSCASWLGDKINGR